MAVSSFAHKLIQEQTKNKKFDRTQHQPKKNSNFALCLSWTRHIYLE